MNFQDFKEELTNNGKRVIDNYGEDLAMQVADKVVEARIHKGWTQEVLAQKVGTHQSSIARLESGVSDPSLNFIKRVAKALGTVWLVGGFAFELEYTVKTVSSSTKQFQAVDMGSIGSLVLKK